MRVYFTRLVILNTLVCAIIGAVFGASVGQMGVGLAGGLLFGAVFGLITEWVFQRWIKGWWYRRRLVTLVFLEVLLALYVFLPAYLSYFSLRPTRIPVPAAPGALAETAQAVSLQTGDGIMLSGWYIPPRNGVVIIALHGQGTNRTQALPHAQILINQGYGVLLMDMRAHGASGGEIFVDGWNAAIDVSAMVDYLHTRPEIERIGALGLSMGAISILHAGAENEAIEAFVADGAGVAAVDDLLDPLIPHPAAAWLLVPDYWMSFRFMALFSGVEPAPPLREQVRRIAPRPILFIAGAESMWEPELAEKYARSAGEGAQAWVIPGAGHTAGIQVATDEYAAHLLTFFDAALLVD